jgi:hypothetical protein
MPPLPRRTLVALLICVALTGCRTGGKSRATASAEKSQRAAELVAPLQPELGRIISLQSESRTALVEFVPQFRLSAPLAGQSLVARNLVTLEETARLVASPHQRGRILGVYVISGTPSLGDEVVIVPPAP